MSASISLWFHLFGGRMSNNFHRKTGLIIIFKHTCPGLIEKRKSNRFFKTFVNAYQSRNKRSETYKITAYWVEKKKKNIIFQNHVNKLNSKNRSNPRIWIQILCPNSHRLVAQRLVPRPLNLTITRSRPLGVTNF